MSTHECPDPEELLRQARTGNGEALGRLLERYRSYLALAGPVADWTAASGQGRSDPFVGQILRR